MSALSKIVVIFFLGTQVVLAEVNNDTLNKMAKELFEVERFGFRFQVPDGKKRVRTFSFTKMYKQLPQEEGAIQKVFIEGEALIQEIKNIERNLYRVKIKVDDLEDSFVMIVHRSPRKIAKYGRAEFISPTDRIYMDSFFK